MIHFFSKAKYIRLNTELSRSVFLFHNVGSTVTFLEESWFYQVICAQKSTGDSKSILKLH